MKAGTKFLVGFIAAAITFATLMAFAKPYACNRSHNNCRYNDRNTELKDTTKTNY